MQEVMMRLQEDLRRSMASGFRCPKMDAIHDVCVVACCDI